MGVLDNFFAHWYYTGIGTSVSSLKHVMKSTTKKKNYKTVTSPLFTIKKVVVLQRPFYITIKTCFLFNFFGILFFSGINIKKIKSQLLNL